mmetsp:Transcript_16910/g.38779  ORF Transcript_16910/g.38779 Transcript_16910/m.38779 type:complete len:98 (+) Transcript_16910:2251-2544(+)
MSLVHVVAVSPLPLLYLAVGDENESPGSGTAGRDFTADGDDLGVALVVILLSLIVMVANYCYGTDDLQLRYQATLLLGGHSTNRTIQHLGYSTYRPK